MVTLIGVKAPGVCCSKNMYGGTYVYEKLLDLVGTKCVMAVWAVPGGNRKLGTCTHKYVYVSLVLTYT